MESNLQGHRTYFQSPFYAMMSAHGQTISNANSLPYVDSCCSVPGYLPYHSYTSRPYEVPCVYHPSSCADPQLQLAAFQGKNIKTASIAKWFFFFKYCVNNVLSLKFVLWYILFLIQAASLSNCLCQWKIVLTNLFWPFWGRKRVAKTFRCTCDQIQRYKKKTVTKYSDFLGIILRDNRDLRIYQQITVNLALFSRFSFRSAPPHSNEGRGEVFPMQNIKGRILRDLWNENRIKK